MSDEGEDENQQYDQGTAEYLDPIMQEGGYGIAPGYQDPDEEDAEDDPYTQDGDYKNYMIGGGDDDEDSDDDEDDEENYQQGDPNEYNPTDTPNADNKTGNKNRNLQAGGIAGLGSRLLNSAGQQRNNDMQRRMGQSSEQDRNDPFDTIFIKKYYRRIRDHTAIRGLFDKLNLAAGPFITSQCAGMDYTIVLFKPKYVYPHRKLDAIIEIVLIDDGIASAMLSNLYAVLDFVLHLPVIKSLGDMIVSACAKAGIFNDGLMRVNNMYVNFKNYQEKNRAQAKYTEAQNTTRIAEEGRSLDPNMTIEKARKNEFNAKQNLNTASANYMISRQDQRKDRQMRGQQSLGDQVDSWTGNRLSKQQDSSIRHGATDKYVDNKYGKHDKELTEGQKYSKGWERAYMNAESDKIAEEGTSIGGGNGENDASQTENE